MLAKYFGEFYFVVDETDETITIAWYQTTKYRFHEVGRIVKSVWFKPGCGEDFEQIDELIGIEDFGG